jgi:hypothetical protein
MVGMWRFLQDNGSDLNPDFHLSHADDVIRWSLECVSVTKADLVSTKMRRGCSQRTGLIGNRSSLKPLANAADPFTMVFLYQLLEAPVRFAHPRLGDTFPDSLILQLTRFLENSNLMPEDEPPKNPYSIFRKSISTSTFDDIVTRFSPALIQLYLECSRYALGTSRHQIRQLETGAKNRPERRRDSQ